MLVSIAEMSYDYRIREKIELFSKANKGDVRFERFMLSLK
jgi:hypothetical protein